MATPIRSLTSSPSWSLAFGWAERDGEPYSIFLLDPATGERRRLTGPPPAISGDGEPSWSPDGTRIAFLRNVYPLIQDLYTVPAAGGTARRITDAPRKIRDVEWSADGSELVFTLYDAGDHRLWTVPAAGGEPAPSPVGGEGEIWVSGDDWAAARRLTDFGGPYTGQPSWSPGAEWIAFTSTAGGDADVWRIESRGGLPERLTSATSDEVAPWWSADGRRLYYSSNRTGVWELWRQPAEPAEGGERRAEHVTRGGGHRAVESPDHRWGDLLPGPRVESDIVLVEGAF